MPTAHISAADGDFARDVLVPGDPRRATRIAEAFLDEPELAAPGTLAVRQASPFGVEE